MRNSWWPAFALLCLSPMLLVLPAVPIDETRYLSVAWEMRQSGAWITPHLNGAPYFDKPPLLFWLVNLMWRITGPSLWSARMVSLVCGALGVMLCGVLEKRLAGDEGTPAAWLLAGSLFFALFSGVLMFDVALCLFVLLAFLAVVDYVQSGSRRALLLLFVASCLGTFAKGPVVMLHLGGPILLSPWWSRGATAISWRSVVTLLLTAIAGGLPVLAWAWLALRGLNPGEAHYLLIHQTTGRVVQSFAHNRSLWWYLPFLPALMLPWIAIWRWRALPGAALRGMKDPAMRFGLCASAPAFIAFCVVSGKQVHYLLPLMPGACLIFGAWQRQVVDLFPLRRWWVSVVLVGAGVILSCRRAPEDLWSHALALALVLACAAWVRVGRRSCALPAACVASLLLTAALLPILRAQVIGPIDPSELASRVAGLRAHGVPVVRTPNEPGMLTYLGRQATPIPQSTQLREWAQANPQGFVIDYSSHGRAPADAVDSVRLANGWIALLPAARIPDHPEIQDRHADEYVE
ncbi:ArnT family glycosyltransferase [Dyella terrae]|uniref:ArnT family glycosyltransferase n=1 Tax=Dyella terrae TaxID=522259 RepID=UPI0013F15901|nr:glycosyltransferase family 39 protein [Dyella terrae]